MIENPTPALGDWLMPRDPDYPPGMVVELLPSGEKVILGSYLLPRTWGNWPAGGYVEAVHKTNALKGPMTGRRVTP